MTTSCNPLSSSSLLMVQNSRFGVNRSKSLTLGPTLMKAQEGEQKRHENECNESGRSLTLGDFLPATRVAAEGEEVGEGQASPKAKSLSNGTEDVAIVSPPSTMLKQGKSVPKDFPSPAVNSPTPKTNTAAEIAVKSSPKQSKWNIIRSLYHESLSQSEQNSAGATTITCTESVKKFKKVSSARNLFEQAILDAQNSQSFTNLGNSSTESVKELKRVSSARNLLEQAILDAQNSQSFSNLGNSSRSHGMVNAKMQKSNSAEGLLSKSSMRRGQGDQVKPSSSSKWSLIRKKYQDSLSRSEHNTAPTTTTASLKGLKLVSSAKNVFEQQGVGSTTANDADMANATWDTKISSLPNDEKGSEGRSPTSSRIRNRRNKKNQDLLSRSEHNGGPEKLRSLEDLRLVSSSRNLFENSNISIGANKGQGNASWSTRDGSLCVSNGASTDKFKTAFKMLMQKSKEEKSANMMLTMLQEKKTRSSQPSSSSSLRRISSAEALLSRDGSLSSGGRRRRRSGSRSQELAASEHHTTESRPTVSRSLKDLRLVSSARNLFEDKNNKQDGDEVNRNSAWGARTPRDSSSLNEAMELLLEKSKAKTTLVNRMVSSSLRRANSDEGLSTQRKSSSGRRRNVSTAAEMLTQAPRQTALSSPSSSKRRAPPVVRSLEDLRSVSMSSRMKSIQKADSQNAAWTRLIEDVLVDSNAVAAPDIKNRIGAFDSKEIQSVKSPDHRSKLIGLLQSKVDARKLLDENGSGSPCGRPQRKDETITSREGKNLLDGDGNGTMPPGDRNELVQSGVDSVSKQKNSSSVTLLIDGEGDEKGNIVKNALNGSKTKVAADSVGYDSNVIEEGNGNNLVDGKKQLVPEVTSLDASLIPREHEDKETIEPLKDSPDAVVSCFEQGKEGKKDDNIDEDDKTVNSFVGEKSGEDHNENALDDVGTNSENAKEGPSKDGEELVTGDYQMEGKYHTEETTVSKKRRSTQRTRRTARSINQRQSTRPVPKSSTSWWNLEEESGLDSSDEIIVPSGWLEKSSPHGRRAQGKKVRRNSKVRIERQVGMWDSDNALSVNLTQNDYKGELFGDASTKFRDDEERSNAELIAFIRGDDSADFSLDGSNHSSQEFLSSMLPGRRGPNYGEEENDTSFCESLNSSIENLMTNLLPKRKIPFDPKDVVPTPIDVIRNLLRILPERASNPITIDFKDRPLDEVVEPASCTLNDNTEACNRENPQMLSSNVVLDVDAIPADSPS